MDLKSIDVDNKVECKGIYFRCSLNNYWNSEKKIFNQQVRFSFLARKSCDGCNRCGALFEDMQCSDKVLTTSKNPEHGKLYEAVFVPGGTDWETGYLDDWSWELVLVKENGISTIKK